MALHKVYVDYSEITIDEGTFITELTWLNGDDYGYVPRHYFVDYPGVKNLERQVSEVIGGSPLIRYSMPVVLQTFINEVGFGEVLFTSEEKASIEQYKTEHAEYWKEIIGTDGDFTLQEEKEGE